MASKELENELNLRLVCIRQTSSIPSTNKNSNNHQNNELGKLNGSFSNISNGPLPNVNLLDNFNAVFSPVVRISSFRNDTECDRILTFVRVKPKRIRNLKADMKIDLHHFFSSSRDNCEKILAKSATTTAQNTPLDILCATTEGYNGANSMGSNYCTFIMDTVQAWMQDNLATGCQKPENRTQRPESRKRELEIRNQKTKTRKQKPENRNQKTETRKQKPENRNQKTETRKQKPENRNQESESRKQKPETRNQESETRKQKTGILIN
nr:unnamed protein product [Callosobruchus chinensis]